MSVVKSTREAGDVLRSLQGREAEDAAFFILDEEPITTAASSCVSAALSTRVCALERPLFELMRFPLSCVCVSSHNLFALKADDQEGQQQVFPLVCAVLGTFPLRSLRCVTVVVAVCWFVAVRAVCR